MESIPAPASARFAPASAPQVRAQTAPEHRVLPLNVILVGGGSVWPCAELLRRLRRHHHVIHLLPRPDHPNVAETGAAVPPPVSDCQATEAVFRSSTGRLRRADLIIVCSDVTNRDAVVGWVLDQACGVVIYCSVGPGAVDDDSTGSGNGANGELRHFDLCLSCTASGSVEALVAALEHHLAVLTSRAQ